MMVQISSDPDMTLSCYRQYINIVVYILHIWQRPEESMTSELGEFSRGKNEELVGVMREISSETARSDDDNCREKCWTVAAGLTSSHIPHLLSLTGRPDKNLNNSFIR